MKPYRDGTNCIILPHGPHAVLSAPGIMSLGMVFHEPATNALKYGALPHRVERCFNKLKNIRRLATHLGFTGIAYVRIWLRHLFNMN